MVTKNDAFSLFNCPASLLNCVKRLHPLSKRGGQGKIFRACANSLYWPLFILLLCCENIITSRRLCNEWIN